MSQSKASGRKSVAGMGSIRKKEKVINGKAYTYYEARYTVGIDPGTGKQIQKSISGKTQREVTRRLKEITTSIDTGTYLPSCKLTVGEWLNTWISEYTADWKPLTVCNYSKQIKKHLIPRLGAAKLEDLDTHTIQLFYNSLTNGQHQLRIEAVDGNFATSVRVFSFSKKETVIKFELVAPEETDAAATKVLVTPTWKIEGAVAKVEACNNGFDAVPTWEDITAMVQINRVYNFTNKTKTASKWGVNIRFTITKNEGFEGEVSISGFGGAYE